MLYIPVTVSTVVQCFVSSVGYVGRVFVRAVSALSYCLAFVVLLSSWVVLSVQVSVMLCGCVVVPAVLVFGRFVVVWMQSRGIGVVALVFVFVVLVYWVPSSVWAVSVLVANGASQ